MIERAILDHPRVFLPFLSFFLSLSWRDAEEKSKLDSPFFEQRANSATIRIRW